MLIFSGKIYIDVNRRLCYNLYYVHKSEIRSRKLMERRYPHEYVR